MLILQFHFTTIAGLLLTVIATSILISSHKYMHVGTMSPPMVYCCCVLLLFTFTYGLLHVVQPSDRVCEVQNAGFFVLLMGYSAIVMIQTKFFTHLLVEHMSKLVQGG